MCPFRVAFDVRQLWRHGDILRCREVCGNRGLNILSSDHLLLFRFTWWLSILALRLSAKDAVRADGLLPAEGQSSPSSVAVLCRAVAAPSMSKAGETGLEKKAEGGIGGGGCSV